MIMSTPQLDERAPAEVWLSGFPAHQHGTVEAWFRHVISRGAQGPDAVLIAATVLIGHKADWSVEPASRQLCHAALQALRCNRRGALAYASHLLEECRP